MRRFRALGRSVLCSSVNDNLIGAVLVVCYMHHVSSCKEYNCSGAGTERDESSVWGNVLFSLRYEQNNTKVLFGEVLWGTNKSMRGKQQQIGLEQP